MTNNVRMAYASILNATSTLLKPAEIRVSSEKAVIAMNRMATNHGAQPLFANRL